MGYVVGGGRKEPTEVIRGFAVSYLCMKGNMVTFLVRLDICFECYQTLNVCTYMPKPIRECTDATGSNSLKDATRGLMQQRKSSLASGTFGNIDERSVSTCTK